MENVENKTEVINIANELNPELTPSDGTVVAIGYSETVNTGNYQNFKPEVRIEIPTNRKMIKKTIQKGFELVKSEFDKIVKDILAQKGL